MYPSEDMLHLAILTTFQVPEEDEFEDVWGNNLGGLSEDCRSMKSLVKDKVRVMRG
jgi:hypothetical protein